MNLVIIKIRSSLKTERRRGKQCKVISKQFGGIWSITEMGHQRIHCLHHTNNPHSKKRSRSKRNVLCNEFAHTMQSTLVIRTQSSWFHLVALDWTIRRAKLSVKAKDAAVWTKKIENVLVELWHLVAIGLQELNDLCQSQVAHDLLLAPDHDQTMICKDILQNPVPGKPVKARDREGDFSTGNRDRLLAFPGRSRYLVLTFISTRRAKKRSRKLFCCGCWWKQRVSDLCTNLAIQTIPYIRGVKLISVCSWRSGYWDALHNFIFATPDKHYEVHE